MNNEESMNLRMQNLLKKRRVEKKRFDDEIKSIELNERKVILAYERTRQDFVNLVNTKRRRWWLSDENVRREFAKREWKNGFIRPDPISKTGYILVLILFWPLFEYNDLRTFFFKYNCKLVHRINN